MENSHVDCNTLSRNMQAPFQIDPEFQDKIPPIGEDEFRRLRENILDAGEVYDPLVVWKKENILVDGHNRWKVIQENPNIIWRFREMEFSDKWAAFEWMYKNQLGRRNLTDEQRAYTVGKMYESRKKSEGGQSGNANALKRTGQNAQVVSRREIKDGTAGEIGREVGMDSRTVRRNAQFAQGIDALREFNAEAADKVLTGNARVPKQTVAEIAKMEPNEVEAAAEAILSGMAVETCKQPKNTKVIRRVMDEEERANMSEIKAIADEMYDPSTKPNFTVDMLIEDIEMNADIYVQLLSNTLTDRIDLLTDENKPRIAVAINKVVEKIIEVRDSI